MGVSAKKDLYPELRLQRIIEIIKKEKTVKVDDLAALFAITGATVRSDLRRLEIDNILIRTHGGAILREHSEEHVVSDRDLSYNKRLLQNLACKEAIGEAAASLINDGDSIMLDDGSTTFQVAKKLGLDKQITVITNGLNICFELSKNPSVQVIATGGMLNKPDLSYHGRAAEEFTSRYTASKAILGASGVSIQRGVTAPSEMKAELKKVMIGSSTELIIVADHTKIQKGSLMPVCNLSRVSILVTDDQAPEEALELFRKSGVVVIIA